MWAESQRSFNNRLCESFAVNITESKLLQGIISKPNTVQVVLPMIIIIICQVSYLYATGHHNVLIWSEVAVVAASLAKRGVSWTWKSKHSCNCAKFLAL